jgi:hypothetical protein
LIQRRGGSNRVRRFVEIAERIERYGTAEQKRELARIIRRIRRR